MKVVLDTNVLVSGFLNPYNPPGALVLYAAEGRLQLCYDARILSEYRDVLLRPKFGFKAALMNDFLAQVEAEGFAVAGEPLSRRLPDPWCPGGELCVDLHHGCGRESYAADG